MTALLSCIRPLAALLALSMSGGIANGAGTQPAKVAPAQTSEKILELKVIGQEPFIFSAAAPSASFVLPVQLPAGIDGKGISLERLQVRHEKLLDATIDNHFSVAPKLIDDRRLSPGIMVTVTEVERLLPGAYQLTLAVRDSGKAVLAPLTVTLERPSVQLQPPGKQTLDLSLPYGWGAAADSAPALLRLAPLDNARASAIRDVRLHDGPFTGADGLAVAATLAASAASVPAGAPLVLSLAPKGFPDGVTQGKLEVRSADLKAPMSIDVEVRGRLWPLWIPLMVGLGILVGFILRIYLQRRADLATARDAGLAAIAELQELIAPVHDPRFIRTVAPVLSRFHDALLGRKPADITACQTLAKSVVEKALADLRKALQVEEARLVVLRRFDSGAGNLPPSLQAAVDPLPPACDEAARLLAKQDAATAQVTLDAAYGKAVTALKGAWPQWKEKLAALNEPVLALHDFMDASLDARRKLDAADAIFSLAQGAVGGAAPALPDFDKPEAVATGLDEWRQIGVRRKAALLNWAGYLDEDLIALDELVQQRLPDPRRLSAERKCCSDALRVVADALEKASATDDAFAPVGWTDHEARAAVHALARAVRAQQPDLSPEAGAAFESALTHRQYMKAVGELPRPPADQRLGGERKQPAELELMKPLRGGGKQHITREPKPTEPTVVPVIDAGVLASISTGPLKVWQIRGRRLARPARSASRHDVC